MLAKRYRPCYPFALPFGVPLMYNGHAFHLYHSLLSFVCAISGRMGGKSHDR